VGWVHNLKLFTAKEELRYVKDLLAHFSIKTTEIYLHVKKEDLLAIINPLDELYKGKSWDS
jgi:integrase/recombinase XerD